MGRLKFFWIAVFGLAITLCGTAHAAQIEVLPKTIQGYTPIRVSGKFELGDQDRFEAVAWKYDKAIVLFDSMGGEVRAGIGIGKLIHLKKYASAIEAGKTCASACAMAWLGGVERVIVEPGRVGFHAAYYVDNGTAHESGVANALVGAYFNQLELTSDAISFLTEKPPEQINWLTKDLAATLGIDVSFVPEASNTPVGDLSTVDSQSSVEIAPPSPQPTSTPPIASPSPNLAPREDSDDTSFVTLQDRDVYGYDLGKPENSGSAEECRNLCQSAQQCLAFTFDAAHHRCYQKSDGSRVWWAKGIVTGFRKSIQPKLTFYSLILRPGETLRGERYLASTDSKPELCADLCSSQNLCTGFNFSRRDGNQCSLMTGRLKLVRNRGSLAGVKTAKDSSPD